MRVGMSSNGLLSGGVAAPSWRQLLDIRLLPQQLVTCLAPGLPMYDQAGVTCRLVAREIWSSSDSMTLHMVQIHGSPGSPRCGVLAAKSGGSTWQNAQPRLGLAASRWVASAGMPF